MIADPGSYIPYDVQKIFRTTKIGFSGLFPKLNAIALREETELNYDLLAMGIPKELF